MKKLINFTLMAIACLSVACHKDALLTTLAPIKFTSSVTASTNQVILTSATDSTSGVLTLKWPAVVYPVKAHVTYTLQADLPADTVGSTAWANATSLLIGSDVLTKSFKGAELNALALKVGIAPNDTAKLVFRVQAYQDRATFTHGVTVSVSPWKLIIITHGWATLWVPGDYQGWSPGTATTVAAEQPNIYEGFIYEPAGGTYQFKFTSAPDWNHINYGDSGTSGKLTTDGNAAGMTLPGPGYYELVCNPTTLTWSYTLTTWGIIGDATPGGWNSDTELTYDPVKQVWTVTANMTTAGSFKFRANNAWSMDFGDIGNGQLGWVDNPAFPYNGSIPNLTVPSNGSYTITLDLHDPNNYNYTLHKN